MINILRGLMWALIAFACFLGAGLYLRAMFALSLSLFRYDIMGFWFLIGASVAPLVGIVAAIKNGDTE